MELRLDICENKKGFSQFYFFSFVVSAVKVIRKDLALKWILVCAQ